MNRSKVQKESAGFGTKRRARELAERERVILCAAERLIGHHGFHGAGMSEIAREAEYAIGTLYGLFPSKEALFERLVESRAQELATSIHAALDGAGSARERLVNAWHAKREFFARHLHFLRIYASASPMASTVWGAPAGAARIRRDTLRAVADTIATGQRRGELAAGASASDLAVAFQNLSTSFLIEAVGSDGELDVERASEAMERVYFERTLLSGPATREARARRAPPPASPRAPRRAGRARS